MGAGRSVAVTAAALVMIGIIGFLDRLTGAHLGLSLLYLPPIAWVAWVVGPRAGWAIALLATGVWFVADLQIEPDVLALARGWNALLRLGFFGVVVHLLTRLRDELARRSRVIAELEEAMAQIRTLRGLLPLCAWCGRIRDDEGYWERLDTYVTRHTHAELTHGICPECHASVAGEQDASG